MKTKSRNMNFAIAISSEEGEIPNFLVYETKKERDSEFKRLFQQGYYECLWRKGMVPIYMMTKCHFNSTVYYLDKKVN